MATIKLVDKVRNAPNEEVTVDSILTRGVHEVIPESLEKKLKNELSSRRIKLYLGIDPTSPHLHIGHTVPLRKLREFQDLGHEVILLFGTFTAMIGDPTDKSASRIRLTKEQVENNIATYKEQAGKILDLSPKAKNPIKIVHNDEWLGKLNFPQVLDLMAEIQVSHLLTHSTYKQRLDASKPVAFSEFAYPLMQGYDSVALEVDLEVGGRDQRFNMLVGRTLSERILHKEKFVMTTKFIEDPSGKKMGKTEGNVVNIEDPAEWMYEAIMTWPDTAILLGLELLTSVPMKDIKEIQESLDKEEINPMELKEAFAYRVVKELHGEKQAQFAEEEFSLVKRKGEAPRNIIELKVDTTSLPEIILQAGFAKDPIEAEIILKNQQILANGERINAKFKWDGKPMVLQLGTKTISKVRRVVK